MHSENKNIVGIVEVLIHSAPSGSCNMDLSSKALFSQALEQVRAITIPSVTSIKSLNKLSLQQRALLLPWFKYAKFNDERYNRKVQCIITPRIAQILERKRNEVIQFLDKKDSKSYLCPRLVGYLHCPESFAEAIGYLMISKFPWRATEAIEVLAVLLNSICGEHLHASQIESSRYSLIAERIMNFRHKPPQPLVHDPKKDMSWLRLFCFHIHRIRRSTRIDGDHGYLRPTKKERTMQFARQVFPQFKYRSDTDQIILESCCEVSGVLPRVKNVLMEKRMEKYLSALEIARYEDCYEEVFDLINHLLQITMGHGHVEEKMALFRLIFVFFEQQDACTVFNNGKEKKLKTLQQQISHGVSNLEDSLPDEMRQAFSWLKEKAGLRVISVQSDSKGDHNDK